MHKSLDPAALDSPDLPVRLGRYTLNALLGQGGVGRVYQATLHGPAGFRKEIAIKVLKAGSGQDLAREARLGALLKHPNLVDTYDLDQIEDCWLVAMEWVRGPTVRQVLRSRGPLPPRAALDIVRQAAAGVHHAHTLEVEDGPAGLVHRDLKPGNLLIDRSGLVKVADLGIAVLCSGSQGVAAGTPAYMAPEQVRGEQLDGRTDQFALGLVLCELITGTKVLGGRSLSEAVGKVLRIHRLLRKGVLQRATDAVVPGIGDLVQRCLQPDPAARFASCGALAEALSTFPVTGPGILSLLSHHPGPQGATSVPTPSLSGADEPTLVRRPAPGNLKAPRGRFFGRSSELESLKALFGTEPCLVTLHGPGGAGKTTLSRRFGSETGFPGGLWFADLTEVASATGICNAVADALGVPLGAGDADQLSAQVGLMLKARGPLLLVLDNFEQVVAHGPATVGRWREAAPDARFLATSREILGLAGERVLQLGPLDDEEAVALLVHRARHLGADRWADPAVQPVLKQIAQRLDGLPLALELGAARARVLSPDQVLERLGERFRLLRGGKRGVTPRQATLEGAIGWSWDLLSDHDRRTLTQLSTFRGGFTIEDAEAVVDLGPDDPWVLDVVDELWRKALLTSREIDGQPRFTMYESIRAFAADRLDDPGVDRRHATHFARLAEPHHGDAHRDLENLLKACRWGLATHAHDLAIRCARAATTIFAIRGPFDAGIDLLEPLLEARPDDFDVLICMANLTGKAGRPTSVAFAERAVAAATNSTQRARATIALAEFLLHRARLDDALEHAVAGLALAEDAGELRVQSRGQMVCGMIRAHLGALDESRAHYEAARDLAARQDDRRLHANALSSLGNLQRIGGAFEEAAATLECALRAGGGILSLEAGVHGNLGIVYRQRGDLAKAAMHYTQALAIYQNLGQRRDEGIVTCNLGVLGTLEGDLARSGELFARGVRIGEEIEDDRLRCNALLNLASVTELDGDVTGAHGIVCEARDICERIQDVVGLGVCNLCLSYYELERGNLVLARQRADDGYDMAIATGSRRYQVLGRIQQSAVVREDAHLEEAEALGREALVLGREVGDVQFMGLAALELGRTLTELGRVNDALEILAESEEAFLQAGDLFKATSVRVDLAEADLAGGRCQAATTLLEDLLHGEGPATRLSRARAAAILARIRRIPHAHERAVEQIDALGAGATGRRLRRRWDAAL